MTPEPTADPAPPSRLAGIRERWDVNGPLKLPPREELKPAMFRDIQILLDIADRAQALLAALRANSERYQPGDAGEAESWYVQGAVMAWVDGEPPEPNPYGGPSQVYDALTALSEALETT